jgi:hypothetical protein
MARASSSGQVCSSRLDERQVIAGGGDQDSMTAPRRTANEREAQPKLGAPSARLPDRRIHRPPLPPCGLGPWD